MSTGTVLSKDSLQLIAKLVASGSPLVFTRAAVGTGKLPSGYDPGSMTGLNNYRMDGEISKIEASGEQADISFQISSIGVDTGFIVTEAGLFAEDPDKGEILFSYLDLSADPQYIYPENSTISKFFELTMSVIIGRVSSVTAFLSPGSLVTREQLNAEVLYPEFNDSGKVKGISNFTDFLNSLKSKMSFYDILQNLKAGLMYVLHVDQLVSATDNESTKLPAAAAAVCKVQQQVTCLRNVIVLNLPLSGWSSTAPYTQTVAAAGVTADMDPLLVSMLADGASAATQKEYNKAFGIISSGTGTTGDGTVTFKVYKKPAIDCTVGLKGV